MRALGTAVLLVCLSISPLSARGQYFSATYGYGSPLVVGYRYPSFGYPYAGYRYDGYPIRIGYPIGYGYTWPYYLDAGTGYLGPYVAPPLYVPPEQLGFGPQAVRRFMGVEPARRPIVNRNIIVAPRAANEDIEAIGNRGDAANDGVNPARLRVRESNAEARQRARQFLEFGDEQFAALNLAGAYDRYKKAADAAPDLAEPYFRLGHTLVAMGRYEQAVDSFGRGLNLQPDWPSRGTPLAEVYRDKDVARFATLDTLKRAAATQPDDEQVQFVAGVQFYFDGQTEMARGYFERAKALGAPAPYVEPFLKSLRKEPADELDI